MGDKRDTTATENRIEESLTLYKNRFGNIIDFANYIMKKKLRHKGEQRLRCNLGIWEKGGFDILNEIDKTFTLVQLIESL